MSVFKLFLVCLVGLTALSLCEASVIPSSVKPRLYNESGVPFELDDFLNRTFSASSWNGTWITDTSFIFRSSDGDILKYDVSTQSSEEFLGSSVLDGFTSPSFALSEDQAYVLIRYNVSAVFRHSTTSIYTVYGIASGDYYHINDQNPVQLATFAPSGHGIAYVIDNNIYYLSNFTNLNNTVQVTTDGQNNLIYCGVPDWVYEEEVLGGGSALWISPQGNSIAYAVFNDSNVDDFNYFVYGTPGDLTSQYPTIAEIKYPKVGRPNPVVTIFVYNILTQNTTEFQLPDSIHKDEDNNDYVLYDMTWISEEELAMISTNRIQNESIIVRCTVSDGVCTEEVSYKQEGGWLRPSIPKYSSNGSRRLQILPQPLDDDHFDHLVLTDIETNSSKQLTFGNRVVTTIYGWDEDSGLIYYGGSVNDTPSQNHVYVVNSSDSSDQCLTCDWMVDDEPCKYAAAAFSKSFSYYARVCSGPNPIYVEVKSINNADTTILWQGNTVVRERLALKRRPTILDMRVPLTGNFTARVRLFLPPNLNESRKYPALVYVYAGPNSIAITDTFSSGVLNYLVTNREYIYIFIDGRGTGRDGLNKMHSIYRNLAGYEIDDQITVMKYLQDNLTYIDANNTGIWGWSYGGFASTWALVKDTQNVFQFALAVAPVTSFIYYDTIYTERFMGLPTEEDNLIGYNNTDLSRRVEDLRGKKYFIIHGNADDNVHYHQTLLLIKALEHADISFRQQSYPDENHSLTYVSRHLYHTLDLYWARCFGLEGPPIATWKK